VDQTVILRAGLGMADAQGLGAVSMRAIAADLGVAPMTLYRHVAGIAELRDGLVDLVLGEILQLPAAATGCDEPIGHLIRAVRMVGRAHPAIFALLLDRRRSSPTATAVHATFRTALLQRGISWSDVGFVVDVLGCVLIGAVAAEGHGWSDLDQTPPEERVSEAIDQMLHAFVDQQIDPGRAQPR
jgi:AcrR family transcriptional regulator